VGKHNLKSLTTVARFYSLSLSLCWAEREWIKYAIIFPQEYYEAENASANKHNNKNLSTFFFCKSYKEYPTGFT